MAGKRSFWTIALCLTAILLLGENASGYTYSNHEKGRYIYHEFIFDKAEIEEIAGSYRKSQGYSNGMIETIWDLAKGMGSNLGRFSGRVWLGDRLFRMAKDAKRKNWDEMGVRIRSRADEGGKWALEFLDNVADIWKKITGYK